MPAMSDRNSESLRRHLRAFMKKHGLNANRWAKRAGLSEGTIRNFLKGNSSSLRSVTLEKLASAAGVTVGELLGEHAPGMRTTQDITIRAVVESGMGGWAQPLEEKERYQVRIKPRAALERHRLFGVGIEAGDSLEYKKGADLIFAEVEESGEALLETGKTVFYEVQTGQGPRHYIGRLECFPGLISIQYRGEGGQHSNVIYWKAAEAEAGLAEGAGGYEDGHALPPVPSASGSMRILGVLVKSMKDE